MLVVILVHIFRLSTKTWVILPIDVYSCSIACLRLEEYQTAKAALEIGASLASEDSRFVNLIKECDECIAGNVVFLA